MYLKRSMVGDKAVKRLPQPPEER